jgi:uncharacterized protein Smg (DUF494 family)
MNDNLMELLFDLVEKSLAQLKKNFMPDNTEQQDNKVDVTSLEEYKYPIKHKNKVRIVTYQEQMKLTKLSYQFLLRMQALGIITEDAFENILDLLQSSHSRIVHLDETKWAIQKVLAQSLDDNQQAFLDLLLYHKENNHALH